MTAARAVMQYVGSPQTSFRFGSSITRSVSVSSLVSIGEAASDGGGDGGGSFSSSHRNVAHSALVGGGGGHDDARAHVYLSFEAALVLSLVHERTLRFTSCMYPCTLFTSPIDVSSCAEWIDPKSETILSCPVKATAPHVHVLFVRSYHRSTVSSTRTTHSTLSTPFPSQLPNTP